VVYTSKKTLIIIVIAVVIAGLIALYFISPLRRLRKGEVNVRVEVEKIEFSGISSEGLEFKVVLKVFNGENIGAELEGVSFKILYKEGFLGVGECGRVKIEARSSSNVTARLVIYPNQVLASLIRDAAEGKEVVVKVCGKARVEKPIKREVSFEREIAMPVGRPGEFKVEGVDVSPTGKIRIRVSINSRVVIPVNVSDIKLDIFLGEDEIGSGQLVEKLVLEPNTTKTGLVEITLTESGKRKVLEAVLSGEELNIKVKGVAYLEILNLTVEFEFEESRTLGLGGGRGEAGGYSFNFEFHGLENLTLLPPGNIIEGEASVSLIIYSEREAQASIKNLTFSVLESGEEIGLGALAEEVSIKGNFTGRIRFRIVIHRDKMEDFVNGVLNGEISWIEISNMKARIEVMGVEKEIQLEESRIVQIPRAAGFGVSNLRIQDITILPPGNVFEATIKAYFYVSSPIQAPVVIDNVKMKLYEEREGYLSDITYNERIEISEKGYQAVTLKVRIEIPKSKMESLISRMAKGEEVTFIVRDITAEISIYDIHLVLEVPREYSFTPSGKEISFEVVGCTISSIDLVKQEAILLVVVRVDNPYGFGFTVQS